MKLIEFNTKEGSEARQATVPLTLIEENRAIELMNALIESGYKRNALEDEEDSPLTYALDNEDVLQRFINHYQNMSHYRAYTEGLYATDKPEFATHKDFFQIKF